MTTYERITTWKGPTGRTLTPGTRFKVRGRRGQWVFVSYVTPGPTDAWLPHVEARKKASRPGAKGTANIRVIDPDLIYEVEVREDPPDE